MSVLKILVSFLVIILKNIFFLVLAVAANKVDLYENEQVEERLGREFADDIGAYFKYTSAKLNSGVEDLFKELGKRVLVSINVKKTNYKDNEDKNIKLDDNKKDKKKKKCC